MKKFFKLDKPYEFDINDIRAILSIINLWSIVVKNNIMIFVCVLLAAFGVINDVAFNRRINGLVIHFSSLLINIVALTGGLH